MEIDSLFRRYGDVLDPWGDLRVMAQMQCVTTPDASFFIGVPFGLDRIAWNAHRYYGPGRLPQLFANIRHRRSLFTTRLYRVRLFRIFFNVLFVRALKAYPIQ